MFCDILFYYIKVCVTDNIYGVVKMYFLTVPMYI